MKIAMDYEGNSGTTGDSSIHGLGGGKMFIS